MRPLGVVGLQRAGQRFENAFGDAVHLSALDASAAATTRTPAQIALAWLLAQKPWIVSIPGTTKLHRMEENITAAEIELTPDDLREIEDAQLEAQGERYPAAAQQMIDR